MTIRDGWHSEQVRNESFSEVIADEKRLAATEFRVLECLKTSGRTIHEISVLTGMKEHLVSARLNGLRSKEFVITDGEKRRNLQTGKYNSVWKLNPNVFGDKQLEMF